ncbi:hypothetical protein EBESD8_2650 [Rhodococcus aetherivorans]|nr:hypothetical protein EBESD8_2650 [Rhodococcus aetherivorans]
MTRRPAAGDGSTAPRPDRSPSNPVRSSRFSRPARSLCARFSGSGGPVRAVHPATRSPTPAGGLVDATACDDPPPRRIA